MTFIHSPPMTAFMARYDEDQRRWLTDLLARHKLTATELARRAGLNASTLTRFMSGSREGHTLSSRTVRQIETAVVDKRTPEKPGFAEDEARPYHLDEASRSPLAAAIAAIKGGRNGIDAWVITSDDLDGLRLYPGDVVMVDLNATAAPGDIVCAQIYDWENRKAKTVFRLNEPPYLVTGSLRLPARRPEVADGRNIVIKGVVVARLSGRDMLYLSSH